MNSCIVDMRYHTSSNSIFKLFRMVNISIIQFLGSSESMFRLTGKSVYTTRLDLSQISTEYNTLLAKRGKEATTSRERSSKQAVVEIIMGRCTGQLAFQPESTHVVSVRRCDVECSDRRWPRSAFAYNSLSCSCDAHTRAFAYECRGNHTFHVATKMLRITRTSVLSCWSSENAVHIIVDEMVTCRMFHRKIRK